MANRHATLTALFEDIADNIRVKTGGSAEIVADNFDTAIAAIDTDPSKDATITSGDQMLKDVTAYGKGVKYTGTIETRTSEDMTVDGATVTAAAGYYAADTSKSVASGSQGTPVATKSAVSEHTVTITPSATDATGYIVGTEKTGTAVTVTASELVSGNKNVDSGTAIQTGIDVTDYATISINPIPVSTLDSSIIAGEAIEESSGDYAWKSTVSVPAGYHNAQTLEKTFSEIFPAPETPATAAEMRLGYQAYNKSGQLMTGTMSTVTPAFDGGAMSDGGTIGSVTTAPVVMPAISGSVTDITTTARPSGTDGTDYWTLNPAGSVTMTGKVTGSKTITRDAVQYNGAAKGYIDQADNTVVIAADLVGKTVSVDTSVTPSIEDGTDRYIVKADVTLNAPTVDTNGLITTSAAVGTAGYIASAPTSATTQLSTQAATTVTPKITSQTAVEANKYTTGAVSVGPIYEEVATSAGMDAVNVDANIGKMYKYTGTTDTKYTNGRLYVVEDNTYYGLTFTANTAGSTVAMSVTGTPTLGQNFSYSTNKSTWNTFIPGTTTITLTNVGDKVYFKGNNPNGVSESDSIYYTFVMTGSIAASGNIMSLIDNGACNTLVIPNSYCFYKLFNGCSSLTMSPALPATTLANYCYYYMFYSCTNLTTAPALPATTLASCCYDSMFQGCTSLQVNDTSVSGTAEQVWTIPSSGTFTSTFAQSSMFTICAGTRSSDDMAGASGASYTYYTQNTPV